MSTQSKSIKAKSNLAKGEVARSLIYDAGFNEGESHNALIDAIKACDMKTKDAQTMLRHSYITSKVASWFKVSKEAAIKIVDGASFKSAGGTKRTTGKAKRTELQESKLGTFRNNWSDALVEAKVKTVSKQGQHRKPRQTDGGTTGKPTKAKKVTIEASPKVTIEASPKVAFVVDAFDYMQVISKALVTFGALNKEVKGFDDYTKAINDFVIAANRLPQE